MSVHLIRQGGGRAKIQKYGGGGFTVSGEHFRGSIIILPERRLAWPVGDAQTLTLQAMAPLIEAAGSFDLCLIGCGPRTQRLPPEIRAAARTANLHLEIMDTGAACRTFNVLAAEGRALAAALIAI
ncbi:MAG: Mth938-like domain-containing protein [Rhodobacteraceae bacterium]|nr:Mth938-like domain-containing protein [Paracoccaceae bacterium]